MVDRSEWEWLQGDVRAAAAAFADQLRTITDTGQRVPNLEWSVADLAAHLASMPEVYRDQHQLGQGFELPDDWPAFSALGRAHITATDADSLADLVVGEAEKVLSADDPDGLRWLYGRPTTVFNIAAGLLTELILHGQDLGRLTGHEPELTRPQALAGLRQMMVLAPVFIDPDKAKGLAGTYGLRFRGGSEFTYHVDGRGRLSVEEGWPDRADARLNADPAVFIASSLGRVNLMVAGLTGKIVAYGRKPWRLAQLGNAVVDGV